MQLQVHTQVFKLNSFYDIVAFGNKGVIMPISPEVQKMGALASKKSLTKADRKEFGKAGAEARWKKKKGVEWHPPLPEAAYRGKGFLGNEEVECYVLTNGESVISLSQAYTLLTGKTSSQDLPKILGLSGVKSLISNEESAPQKIDFYIPGNPTIASGLRGEDFAEILSAFVQAAVEGKLTTERQRAIAIRCALYQKVFMKVGIVAYIHELTQYQEDRSKKALDEKIKLYTVQEVCKWEKTFPDMFYQELARLCGIADWKKKPSFYGHITNKIYKMVDPDVAAQIKEMADNMGNCFHQYLREDTGLQKLRNTINMAYGVARTSLNIQEFNAKMKLFEPGGAYQMSFPFNQSLIKIVE